jgi:threonine synthase
MVKLEGALPTGSFKDRGASAMVAWLSRAGVERIVVDSSGNAGAAAAAYCARAALECEVHVPADTPSPKLAQLRAYGADIVRVPGPRPAATERGQAVARAGGGVYAPHSWSPAFVTGTQTFAFELWEQLEGSTPDHLVVPLGGGSLLLGAQLGFAALRDAGMADRIPRLHGVQSNACRPLALAFESGASGAVPVALGTSAASGIQIPDPPRAREVLAAVRAGEGTISSVSEEALLQAERELARSGLYAEPTSAVALAGLAQLAASERIRTTETVVVALTGNGLKTGR